MPQRKIALVIGYGQSNEAGTGVAPRLNGTAIAPTDTANNVRHTSVFGQASTSLTIAGTPGEVYTASIFSKLAEHMALETGWEVQQFNFAKGGTAATDSWCGWDTTNNRIKTEGESGYDPGSRIQNFVNGVTTAVSQGYEVWTITAGHQQDIQLGRTVDQIVSASVHIQQRAITAGASKVLVGKTPRFIGGPYEAEFNPGGKIHQIADGVLSAIPGAIIGADLTVNTDIRLCANDTIPYIHLNHAGVCWAAEKWLNAIKAAKLI